MVKKGDKPLFDEDAYDPTVEGLTPEVKAKREMFEQDNDSDLKAEPKSEKIAAFYIEPSLKERLVNFAEDAGVKQSVVLRAAIQEFLNKRGL